MSEMTVSLSRHSNGGMQPWKAVSEKVHLKVTTSDSMVQPHMHRDWFRNVSNLDLVEQK